MTFPRAFVLGALVLVGCKTTHTLDVREDAKLADVEHAEASGERHDGPWTLTTTTEEYASPDAMSLAPRPSSTSQLGIGLHAGGADTRVEADQRLQTPAVLVKRTVAVEEHGTADEAWHSSYDDFTTTETHAAVKAEDKTAPASGCAFSSGLWLALAGVGVLGLVWNRRGVLWAICKRLAGIP